MSDRHSLRDSLLGVVLLIGIAALLGAVARQPATEFQGRAALESLRSLDQQAPAIKVKHVADFLAEHPVRFPILIEPSGPSDTSVLLGNRRGVLPYSVLIDADGVLVRGKVGAFDHGEIEGFVEP